MGILTGLLTLPLAPVRGVVWVTERIADAVDEEIHGAAAIRVQLQQLDEDAASGLVSAEDYEERWEALVERLMEAGRSHRSGPV